MEERIKRIKPCHSVRMTLIDVLKVDCEVETKYTIERFEKHTHHIHHNG
jgi:hypothetical protein